MTAVMEPTEGDRLLQLARTYLRDVLRVPDEVAVLRTLVAELMLEVGMLRLKVEELERRVGR